METEILGSVVLSDILIGERYIELLRENLSKKSSKENRLLKKKYRY